MNLRGVLSQIFVNFRTLNLRWSYYIYIYQMEVSIAWLDYIEITMLTLFINTVISQFLFQVRPKTAFLHCQNMTPASTTLKAKKDLLCAQELKSLEHMLQIPMTKYPHFPFHPRCKILLPFLPWSQNKNLNNQPVAKSSPQVK